MAEIQKNFKSMFQVQLNLENPICTELDLCKGLTDIDIVAFESKHYDTMQECFMEFRNLLNDLQVFFCQFDFMNVTKKYNKSIMSGGSDDTGEYVDLPKDHAVEIEICDSGGNTVINSRVLVTEHDENIKLKVIH